MILENTSLRYEGVNEEHIESIRERLGALEITAKGNGNPITVNSCECGIQIYLSPSDKATISFEGFENLDPKKHTVTFDTGYGNQKGNPHITVYDGNRKNTDCICLFY